MNFNTWSKKVSREKSAEVVVPGERLERTESQEVENLKFTRDFVEYRQLHIEDYLLDNTVEQEGKEPTAQYLKNDET